MQVCFYFDIYSLSRACAYLELFPLFQFVQPVIINSVTRKSSCEKPQEVYHIQHNLSKVGTPPSSKVGTLPHPR